LQAINNRPIIGVLTQPSMTSIKHLGVSYIAASYVKYIESAGARVVPIFHNSTEQELTELFKNINGAFFPGGGTNIYGTKIYKTGKQIIDMAKAAFDNGDYFPVMGHCLGFELISTIVADGDEVLQSVDAENISLPLYFNKDFKNSRMFGNCPSNIVSYYQDTKNPVTLNNHIWSLYPEKYNGNSKLKNFFRIISTNKDRKGKEFISTFEGFKYPVYGIQWHAEKPQFEWNPNEDINHSFESIQSNQYMANFFINEARKSNHKFKSVDEETKTLIYNYKTTYTEKYVSDFEQCYIFDK